MSGSDIGRPAQPNTSWPGSLHEWSWDPTLYAGSAAFYARGRVAYPPAIGEQLAVTLRLDGSGRLLDVGCGPGSLTLLLAPLFAEAFGVDADADMIGEAADQSVRAGINNVRWRHLRAEELPADLPPPTPITFAQSFHWMDRPRVAAIARGMLAKGGALAHVHATTHQGVDTDEHLPHPQPPRAAITTLVQHYLGVERRVGQYVLPQGTPYDEDSVYRGAGFHGPQRIEAAGRTFDGRYHETEERVQAGFSYRFDLAPPPIPVVAKY